MNQGIYEVLSNKWIALDTYEMVLRGDTRSLASQSRPGQFLNIKLEGLYLRRPISVCNVYGNEITIIYKIVGKGTLKLSMMLEGQMLDVLCGLGNGFDIEAAKGHNIAVIGGGVGVPPMYGVARALREQGQPVTAILGFQTMEAAFYIDKFRELGCKVLVTTDDGTLGLKGFVTDALRTTSCDYYLACGPQPMLKSLHKTGLPGQMSFEERMGCGFGACMGCTCHTLVGMKRICKDGPVFKSEEVTFGE